MSPARATPTHLEASLAGLLARIDASLANHTGASLASAAAVGDDLLDLRQMVTAIQRKECPETS